MFRIGDQVRIKVSKVNVDFREIDFELVSVKEDNRLVAVSYTHLDVYKRQAINIAVVPTLPSP